MTSVPSGPRPSDRFIPLYIVAFFVVITCVLGTFVYVALTSYRGVVSANAYEKGVSYNKVINAAETQAAMGYASDITLQQGRVVFSLRDTAGQPVSVSAARVWFFRPTQEGMDQHLIMQQEAVGRYGVPVDALPVNGLWEVRVYAETPQGPYQTSKRIILP